MTIDRTHIILTQKRILMKRSSILLTLFVFLPNLLVGQAEENRTLTLEQAVTIAMEKNSALQEARLDVERADARVKEAWGYALPSIDISGNYTRALKKPVFFLPDFANPGSGRTVPVEIGTNHSMNAGISASQILFNGTVFAGVGAAGIYSDVAHDLYRVKKLETVTTVKRAFFGALLTREARNMMRSNLENAEENLKNVRLMREQGILSEFDELRASVGVDNIRPGVIQAETGYEISLEGLKTAVGLDPHASITLAGSMEFTPVDESLLSAASELVLQRNPAYAALQKQVEVNEAFVLAEKSNYLPTLAAFGNYQYQAAKNTIDISTADFIASSQVGLQLSMNLFQGLQTNARVEQAQVDVRKSQEQLISTERNLQTGITSVIGNLKAAQKRIEAQERTVDHAMRSYSIVTTRFLSGAATQLDVNDAQLALTQAKVNRIQALYDYLIASAEFDQFIGRLPAYVVNEDID
jgi:outer membrane protein TolC